MTTAPRWRRASKFRLGELITDFGPTRTETLPFLSSLLPEGHLHTCLAERAGVNPEREFFLLRALGKNLPGAVTIRPAGADAWPTATPEGAGPGRHRQHSALRFSLAGVQLKLSAIIETSGGLTIPAKGVGDLWIVKLPARQFPGVSENDYAMMTLARLVSMQVPTLQLVAIVAIRNLPEGLGRLAGPAFAIPRLDRAPDSLPVHIEDFAQVFAVYSRDKRKNASPRSIARDIGTEGNNAEDTEFARRLTFSALIGNADMHLKNWSLIYPDRRRAALAPTYDLLSTILYIADDNAALRVSRTRRLDKFTADELSHLAAKALLPERLVLDAAETVALFHQHWQSEKKKLPLSAAVVQAVETHLNKVPIKRGRISTE